MGVQELRFWYWETFINVTPFFIRVSDQFPIHRNHLTKRGNTCFLVKVKALVFLNTNNDTVKAYFYLCDFDACSRALLELGTFDSA